MKAKLRVPKRAWFLMHLALIALIAWILAGALSGALLGRLLAHMPTSSGEAGARLSRAFDSVEPDYGLILGRNIFNSTQTEPDQLSDLMEGSAENAPETTLPIKLIGTIVSSSSSDPRALIVSGGKQAAYKVDDEISGAKIVSIARKRVLLSRSGKFEALTLAWQAPTPKTNPSRDASPSDSYTLQEGYVKEQLADMGSLLTQVRALPNIGRAGKIEGFKIFAIKRGSIFEKAGLKNNDIVRRVNGIEIDSAEKGLELYQALREAKEFEVDITRGSSQTTLRLSLE